MIANIKPRGPFTGQNLAQDIGVKSTRYWWEKAWPSLPIASHPFWKGWLLVITGPFVKYVIETKHSPR